MQMLMEVSLNSIRDILHPGCSEKQTRKGRIALENCISKWCENIQSRWTKTRSQGIHFWFWTEHCWRIVLIRFASCFPKHTQRCRILYFWGKERTEKKGVHDGEYDEVADEGDGAVSQCTARMMDGLWADLLNIKRLWKPLGFSDRQMERGSEREK